MQVENCDQHDIQNTLNIHEDNDCPVELKDDIKTIAQKEGFTKYDLKIKKLPTDGGNYMAELYEIDIIGATKDGEKEINTFVKQINMGSGNLKNIVDLPGIYKTEKFAYKELGKVINELQENAKIPVDERYKMVKCYDSNPTSIVMDNLRTQGYKMYSRTDIVTLDYAELAIKNLAKFHALSISIEKNEPEFYNSGIKPLKYPLNFNDKDWYDYQKSSFSMAMNALESDLRNRVEDIIFSKLDKYREYFESSEQICLCHGDYRVMNLMIRSVGGKIKDIITLDYQILYCGNPLKDFVYFIFSATDKEFRKNHLSHLKDTYFETLKCFLKYFDIDIDEIFPRIKFEKLYEESLDYALILMVSVGPLMFAEESDAPDISNICLNSINFKVHDFFKVLLTSLVEDFIEWGYL